MKSQFSKKGQSSSTNVGSFEEEQPTHPLQKSISQSGTQDRENILRGYSADLDTLTIRDVSESDIEATLGSRPGEYKADRERFERQIPLTETRMEPVKQQIEDERFVQTSRANFSIKEESSKHHATISDYEEIELPTLGRVASTSKELDEKWTTIPDLDQFFCSVYSYYQQNGYRAILTRNLLNIFLLLFVSHVMAFVVLCVNWKNLLSCEDCSLKDIINFDEHCRYPFLSIFVKMLYLLVWFYTLWGILALCLAMQQAGNMRQLFKNEFDISDSQLSFYTWDDIMERLIVLQEKYQFCKVKRELSKYDIVARITRLDNYLVGLLQEGIFDRPPKQKIKLSNLFQEWCSRREKRIKKDEDADSLVRVKRRSLPQRKSGVYFTKVFAWALRASLLTSLFRKQYPSQLDRPSLTPARLRTKFCIIGVILIFCAIPLCLIVILLRVLKYCEKIQKKGKYATVPETARAWHPWAFWRLRGYNELTHELESRLSLAQPASQLLSAPSSAKRMLFQFLALLCGTAFGLILLLSLYDDTLAKGLFWEMAVAGILTNVFAAFAAASPSQDTPSQMRRNPSSHPNTSPYLLIDHTHLRSKSRSQKLEQLRHYLWNTSLDPSQPYLPSDKAALTPLQQFVSNYYQSKTWLLIKEIWSILLLPWLFLGHLAPRSKSICELILSHTVKIEGVGDVYALSTFDLNRFKHPSLRSTDQEEEITESEDENPHMLRRGSSGEIKKPAIRRIPKDLKMEKSYLAFLIRHQSGDRNHSHSEMISLLRKVYAFEEGESYETERGEVDKRKYFEEAKAREARVRRDLEQRDYFSRGKLYSPSRSTLVEEGGGGGGELTSEQQFSLQETFGEMGHSAFQALDLFAFERYLF